MYEEMTLELAVVQREAERRIAERRSREQLGEAWLDLVVEGAPDPAE